MRCNIFVKKKNKSKKYWWSQINIRKIEKRRVSKMHVAKLFPIRSQKFNWPEFCGDSHEEHDEENGLAIMNIISLWFFDISSAKIFRNIQEKFSTHVRSVINWEFCDTRRNFVNIVNIVHIGATCKKDKIGIGIFELEF